MKELKEKSWWIIISMICLLFIFQVITLQEICQHEKHLLGEQIQSVADNTLHIYNMKTLKHPGKIGTNYVKKTARIIQGNIDTTFRFKNTPDWKSVEDQLLYDRRETAQWSCRGFTTVFQQQLSKDYPYLSFSIVRTNSSDSIIDQYPSPRFHSRNQLTLPPIRLSLLDEHYLTITIAFPLTFFWQQASDRILTSCGLLILLIVCSVSLFIKLRNEKRREANRKKFTHSLVHNLRTPILTVKRSLELLQIILGRQLTGEQNSLMEDGKQRTDKTLTDIENLLSLSVNLNGLKLQREDTDLRNMLETLAKEYRMSAPGKSINIHIEALCPDTVFRLDPLHFYGALGNLVGNSIKYSGPDVNINIIYTKKRNKLLLSIQDNGIGIPPEEHKFVFGEHNRGKRFASDRQYKGYGLGLSYVYQVVKAHGGKIRLESDGQHGSVFYIEIPQPRKR